jgi:outer membrane receptor protein involved in Fe transport
MQYTAQIQAGLLVACFSYSLIVHAIGTTDSDALEQELKWLHAENYTITTASRYAEHLTDTPASVTVINAQQLKERRYRYLIDILKDLPSVDVQEKRHQLEYNLITFRGHLHSNKFLILQDGVRIDSPTGEALAIAENFPLYFAKRVEILYGPAAAVYGTEAFSGVINIITENPDDLNGVKISTTLGSYGQHSGYLQAGKRWNENFAAEIGGTLQQANYNDLASQYPQDYAKVDAIKLNRSVYQSAANRENFNAESDSYSLFTKLLVGENLTLGYNRSYLNTPSTTGEKPSKTIYDPNSRWITQTDRVYAQYRFKFNDALNTNSLFYYSAYEINPASKFKNVYVDFIDAYIYAFGDKWALEQQFQYKINASHQLTGGFLYEDFTSIPKTTDLPQAYNPDLSVNQQNLFHIGTDNSLPIEIKSLHYHNIAGYGQWQGFWNSQFSTTVGLRYDHGSRYGGTFNPRAGLVYQPLKSTFFKLLYGEAFRAPTPMDTSEIFGIFSGQRNSAGQYTSSFFRAPNPNLKPEKSRTLEFELSHFFQPEFSLSLQAYYTQLNHLIISTDDPQPIQFIPNGFISSTSSNKNLGSSTLYGFELSSNYQTKLNDDLSLNLWGNYSYIHGHNHRDDNQFNSELVYIAPHKVKLGATLRYQENYFATLKWRWIDKTTADVFDKTNPEKMLRSPAYQIVDLHLGAALFSGLSANIDIYNLFNRHYYAAGSSSAVFNYIPQSLLSLMFSLQYQY